MAYFTNYRRYYYLKVLLGPAAAPVYLLQMMIVLSVIEWTRMDQL